MTLVWTPGFTPQPYMPPQTLGLTAVDAQALFLGVSFGGGFFAGYISHTANGNPTHVLIVAPKATGVSTLRIKTTRTFTANTTSVFDGLANTAAMSAAGITDHPAAQFCVNLSIGGYTDWYLPAIRELNIAYDNLKPTTANNHTSFGINTYSIPPRTVNRTTVNPAQTSVAAFQSGGSEAFPVDGSLNWSSTEDGPENTSIVRFTDGAGGAIQKDNSRPMRAFRRIAL